MTFREVSSRCKLVQGCPQGEHVGFVQLAVVVIHHLRGEVSANWLSLCLFVPSSRYDFRVVYCGYPGLHLENMTEREREIYFKSHISLWEHSSHFRLIGRGVPSVPVVSQLMYKFLCLASPKENP